MNNDDPRLSQRKFGSGDSEGRPRSISSQHRELLRSFTQPNFDRIRAMPDSDLWNLIEACQSVSQTNCGWDAYAFARTYLDVAVSEMRRRLDDQQGDPS